MTLTRLKQTSSAALVGASDDLIAEILLCLPSQYAARLKLVSKRWLSLISNRSFILRYSHRNSDAISGLTGLILLERSGPKPGYSYVSLDGNEITTDQDEPTRYVQCFDPHAPGPIKISDSCNGLLLCYAETQANQAVQCRLYVVNPTTHQFGSLPLPPIHETNWKNLNLAYDPCKSPVYRVYCVEFSNSTSVGNIHEYSSDTGVWKLFPAHEVDLFARGFNGVFCKGAIHWVCLSGFSYRFDVEQKSIQKLPKPSLPEYWNSSTDLKYFGESEGTLHFIALDTGLSTFIVYEMVHEDCSGWVAKYSLDRTDIIVAFPDNHKFQRPLPVGVYTLRLHSFCLVLSFMEVKNEGPKLVMSLHDKIISYSCNDYTFNKLCDFHDKFAKYGAFKFLGTWSCI